MKVKELKKYCDMQIKKGNGNKEIQISCDDEGNGYHTLFYQFEDDQMVIKELEEANMFHDEIDPNNVVLLG